MINLDFGCGSAAEWRSAWHWLARDYALAGFGKIHLECSMPCTNSRGLSAGTIAQRAIELAAVADVICSAAGLPIPPEVIGTEVPRRRRKGWG